MPLPHVGQHHLSIRKRISTKHEPYPSPNLLHRAMDWAVYGMSVLIPVMTIPQVYEALIEKNAEGLVALTWFTYATANTLWILYGILHKEKPIIFANSVMFILNLATAISAVMY